jgi:hypothetical protein
MVLTSSTKIGREGNDHRNQGQRGWKKPNDRRGRDST